jgi:uncharacterized protein (DUF2236 family)
MNRGLFFENADTPLSLVRRRLQRSLRNMLVGPQAEPRDLSVNRKGDMGFYGPGSSTWIVHADAAMLIGGIRALLLQTLHPLAMAGVADHSAYRTDPTGRLHRTAGFVGVTTFGSRAEAKSAVQAVKRVHRRVAGFAPDGRPYSANDPELLAWVHHTLVESFLVAFQRYGSSHLASDRADLYVKEQAIQAKLFGATPGATSVAGLTAWMDQIRPELTAGTQAREGAKFLLFAPLPLAVRPLYAVLASAAVGLLPSWARHELRLPRLPVTETFAVRPTAWTLTQTLGWAMSAPPPSGPNETL